MSSCKHGISTCFFQSLFFLFLWRNYSDSNSINSIKDSMLITEGLTRLITWLGADSIDGFVFNFLLSLSRDVKLKMSQKRVIFIDIINNLSSLLYCVDDKGYFVFEVDILFYFNIGQLIFQHFLCLFRILSDFVLQVN